MPVVASLMGRCWSRRRRLALAAILGVGAACDGGGRASGSADGGRSLADGAVVDAAATAAGPTAEPAAPEVDGLCWPEDGVTDCPGVMRWPAGGSGCASLGDGCPAGDFADGLPGDAIYVLAGAVDGDGSERRPFGTIASALSGSGATIALGKGAYAEEVILPAGIAVVGACPAATTLSSVGASSSRGVITVIGEGVSVSGVQIRDSARPGLAVGGAGASLTIEDVAIDGAELAGVIVLDGGALVARSLLVRGTRPRDGTGGYGIYVAQGGQLDIVAATLVANHDAGLLATDAGTVVRLAASAIIDTEAPGPSSAGGHGVVVQLAADVRLADVLLSNNRDAGIFAIADGSTIDIERSLVRRTRQRANDGKGGLGLFCQDGAAITARALVVAGNHEAGVVASAAHVAIDDAHIRDTQHGGDATSLGVGLLARDGAKVELERVVVDGNVGLGLAAVDPGTQVELRDVVVDHTQPDPTDDQLGHGIEAGGGAEVFGSRVSLRANHVVGLVADGSGTRVALEDAVVSGTLPARADQRFGRGLVVQSGAAAVLSRALFRDLFDVAILADGEGTTLSLAAVRVDGVASEASSEQAGRALSIQRRASAEVADSLFTNLHGEGVLVAEGATATFDRFVVSGVARPACALSRCAEEPVAVGVGVHSEGDARLSDFEIANTGLCGVQVGSGGRLSLSNGEIRGVTVGACVQVAGYELDLLTDRVAFRDNEINIDNTDFALPGSRGAIDLVASDR